MNPAQLDSHDKSFWIIYSILANKLVNTDLSLHTSVPSVLVSFASCFAASSCIGKALENAKNWTLDFRTPYILTQMQWMRMFLPNSEQMWGLHRGKNVKPRWCLVSKLWGIESCNICSQGINAIKLEEIPCLMGRWGLHRVLSVVVATVHVCGEKSKMTNLK